MSRGFTLIELIVATFIIGVLSTVILLNYQTGQVQAQLSRSAAVFETNLRRAQNLAISSADFNGLAACGYGVYYFSDKIYRIYVGLKGAAPNCQSSNHNYEAGIDFDYEEVKVEPGVNLVCCFSIIFFEAPDPTTYIDNNKLAGISTTARFCLENDLTMCRGITIDTAGRIVIQ